MKTIVVDDDSRNRQHVCRLLEAAGHETEAYDTADRAAAAIAVATIPIRLVVTDVCMPGRLDGVDLAELLAHSRPDLPVVVMSSEAYHLERTVSRGLSVPTVQKPVTQAALLAATQEALATANPRDAIR